MHEDVKYNVLIARQVGELTGRDGQDDDKGHTSLSNLQKLWTKSEEMSNSQREGRGRFPKPSGPAAGTHAREILEIQG